MSGELHVPTDLPQKIIQVTIEERAVLAPDPVWTSSITGKSLAAIGIRTPDLQSAA